MKQTSFGNPLLTLEFSFDVLMCIIDKEAVTKGSDDSKLTFKSVFLRNTEERRITISVQ